MLHTRVGSCAQPQKIRLGYQYFPGPNSISPSLPSSFSLFPSPSFSLSPTVSVSLSLSLSLCLTSEEGCKHHLRWQERENGREEDRESGR
jgi:hypothetical protein